MIGISSPKTLNLALQGGGAHGAFTWGVLDRLLDDERITFEGISGTSSGAMNSVALAYGWTINGRVGAQQTLRAFWQSLAIKLPFSGMANILDFRLDGRRKSDHSPFSDALVGLTRLLSPYEFNPLNINPLRAVITDLIDFDRLNAECRIKLFIAATNVRSGKLRLFQTHELSVDALLASACLPALHHAIEIEGETYWDGGYAGNPAVFPLIENCSAHDTLLVLLHPTSRDKVPSTQAEIMGRTAELSFGTTFLREMDWIAREQHRVQSNLLNISRRDRLLNKSKFHIIDSDAFAEMESRSKINNEHKFIMQLYELGRERAEHWLGTQLKHIGRRSSVDLQAVFA